jgi:ectoine hydroxylase-related dioxygenase (phytanoyl-CoA dioxygenase family)
MAQVRARTLTDEELRSMREDGVACLRGVLDRDWIALLTRALEEVLANPGPQGKAYPDMGSGRFGYDTFMWTRNEAFRRFQEESPLPEYAAKVMESRKAFLMVDLAFVKEPRTPNPTPWHHDQPYGWYNGWQVCSFWVPLDYVTIESGALEWIPGSHRWGRWFHPPGFDPSQYQDSTEFEPMPDIEAERSRHRIIHYEMEPGDVLAHHLLTLHSAPGNSTPDRRRRAIAFRYAGDDASYVVRKVGPKPIRDPGLKSGDPFGCELFPQVWPRPSIHSRGDCRT